MSRLNLLAAAASNALPVPVFIAREVDSVADGVFGKGIEVVRWLGNSTGANEGG